MAIIEVDTRGLSCPQPVLMFMDASKNNSEDEFDVLVDTEASKENISRAAKNHGFSVEEAEEPDDVVRLKIRRK